MATVITTVNDRCIFSLQLCFFHNQIIIKSLMSKKRKFGEIIGIVVGVCLGSVMMNAIINNFKGNQRPVPVAYPQ